MTSALGCGLRPTESALSRSDAFGPTQRCGERAAPTWGVWSAGRSAEILLRRGVFCRSRILRVGSVGAGDVGDRCGEVMQFGNDRDRRRSDDGQRFDIARLR
jgi:hypothetical protein